MKMEQLFQFQMVARVGSINGAAQALFLSQSALSQSMKSLEKELDAKLFVRSANGISLTAVGGEFLEQITPLCEQFSTLSVQGKSVVNTAPRLSLSVFYTGYIAHAFTLLCRKYADKNPDFSICEDVFDDMVDHLYAGKANLGIFMLISSSRLLCLNRLEQRRLSFVPIMRMNAYIMLRESHPLLAGKPECLGTKELEDYPYTGSREKMTSVDWLSFSGSSRRKKNTLWTCSRENMTDIILNTDAFSVVPLPDQNDEKPIYPQGITCLPLRDSDLYYELGYIHAADQPLDSIETDYISLLKEEISAVCSDKPRE